MSKKKRQGVQPMIAHPGPTVACNGKTWRFGFNDQDAKGRLEELVRSHVLREALKDKAAIGGQEGDDLLSETRTQIRRGYYSTFEKGWIEVVNSPMGAVLFTLSLLQHHHPDATEQDARQLLALEPEQTEEAIFVVAPDFFQSAASQLGAKPEVARQFAEVVAASIVRKSAPPPASDTSL